MSGNLKRVRTIADFQFGRGAGAALFPEGSDFLLSRTRRIRQVTYEGKRLATVRARDGLLTLGMAGAERLHDTIPSPGMRVIVDLDSVPFVSRGKTAFARHVVFADPSIRARDEVLVVDEYDTLLATGQAVLSAVEMMDFNRGPAVEVRAGQFKNEVTSD